MRALLTISISLFFCHSLVGQDTTFYYSVGTIFEEDAVRAFETDSLYVFFSSTGGGGQSDAYIVSCDKQFEEFSFKTIGTNAIERLIDVAMNDLGEFYLLNQYYSGFGESGYDMQVIKLNSNFEVLDEVVFEEDGLQSPLKMELRNNALFILSEENDIDVLYSIYSLNPELKLDDKFYMSENESFRATSICVDTSVYVLGEFIPQDSNESDVQVLEYDFNGSLLRSQSFGRAGAEVSSNISFDTDSTLLITGSSNSLFEDDFDIYVARLNRNLELIWDDIHGWNPNVSNRDETGIKTAFSGDYFSGLTTSTYGAGEKDFHVYRLNSEGEYENGRSFGFIDDEALKDILLTSDSALLLFGNTNSNQVGQTDLFIVYTSRSLNQGPLDFSIIEHEMEETLELYQPYMKGDHLTLRQTENEVVIEDLSGVNNCKVSLFDVKGNYLDSSREGPIHSFYPKSSGMYILRCDCEGSSTAVFKINHIK